MLRRSCELLSQLVAESPDIVQYRGSLGGAHNNLGLVYERTGRLAEARASYRKAVALQEAAYRSAPARLEFRQFLSESSRNLERALIASGMTDEAAKVAAKHEQLEVSDASQETKGESSRTAAVQHSASEL
jgi:Flp pilus assembly protein TadD